MLTIKSKTDEDSGLDLYSFHLGEETILSDIDPWTMKTIKKLLDHLGEPYDES